MEQLRYISFVLALISSASSLAQIPPSTRTKKILRADYFAISGGVVSNVIVGSEPDFQRKIYNNVMSPRTGPSFALFLKDEITPFFYMKYEVGYLRKGNVSSNNTLWNLNLEYIAVPVKIGFQPVNFLNVTKGIQVGLEGGVAYNFAFSGSTEALANAYSAANNAKVRRSAASVLFGGNFEYMLASKRILFFNTTWYHDLTPLLSYESGNAAYKAGNRGWMFVLGLMFPVIH